MRVFPNTSMMLRSAWSNGRSMLRAAFRRQTCGCVFIMRVSGVASKHWDIHRRPHGA